MTWSLRTLVFCFALFASTAHAQVSVNPFATAPALRAERGETPDAHYRARYEVIGGETPELAITAADDWALVETSDGARLFDFRLGRILELRTAESAFISYNLASHVAFRVMERQNRLYIATVIAQLSPTMAGDGCDAETELGIVIPSLSDAGAAALHRDGAVQSLQCNGRIVGSFEIDDGAAPPRAFWPALRATMTVHPALYAALVETAHAPRRLEATYRFGGGDTATSHTWRLIAVESVSTPYPLDAAFANITAQTMDSEIAPGIGAVAASAIDGSAFGGAYTLERWNAYVAQTGRTDGPAAAALLLSVSLNMFPDLVTACTSGARHAACEPIRNLGNLVQSDVAVRAMRDIIVAEQDGDPAAAVPAMRSVQGTRFASHPALGASYALALIGGGDAVLRQAQAAGLPSDPTPLQIAALRAYPYAAGYWTDFGDRFAVNYQYPQAYWLYDVAASLPVPAAHQGPPLSKQQFLARLRQDFPAFFLAR
ncbi:MAG: hypothetical protein WDM79_06870 [Terricaulis sp.]